MHNLPNILTALRLLLAPVVAYCIMTGRHGAALALFVIAAITDILDGWTARTFNSKTRTGERFDPIADKVLMGCIFLALAIVKSAPRWFVGIVFARDIGILVAVAAFLAFTEVKSLPPSVWGKMSTFFQILVASTIMLANASRALPAIEAAKVLIWTSATLTIWSGIHYAWIGLSLLQNAPLPKVEHANS